MLSDGANFWNNYLFDQGDVLTRRTERYVVMFVLAAFAVFISFQAISSIRVGTYGAAVALDSFLSGAERPTRVHAWAICVDAAGAQSGLRVLPISPALAGTPPALLRGATLSGDCAAGENFAESVFKSRFSGDRVLALLSAGIFPVIACLGLLRRRRLFLFGGIAFCFLPFLYDAFSSSVWTDPAFQFPGQHAYVARNVAQHGIYGWNSNEMLAYGFPPAAVKAWNVGDLPISSGWTYPGYTLVLAIVYAIVNLFIDVEGGYLVIVASALNLTIVFAALLFLGWGCMLLSGSALVGASSIYLLALSGWAWSLCPFPASEPLQALFCTASFALTVRALRRAEFFLSAMLTIAFLSGIGHITKPVLGALPSLVFLIFLFARNLGSAGQYIRPVYIFFMLILVAMPTLILGLRNLIVFERFVSGSTVGNVFLAQSLDIGMKLPDYFGNSELDYGAAANIDVAHRVARIIAEPNYRSELLSQKISLLIPTLTGLSWVAEVGRMGNDGYSGTGLILFAFLIAWTIYRCCASKTFLDIDFAISTIILGFIGVLFLSQPLGRYFTPAAFLLPPIVPVAARELARKPTPEAAKVICLWAVAVLLILLFYWHDGWL